MKQFLILSILSVCAAMASAAGETGASFDTQLSQAKAGIERIVVSAASFDTQLNQAKAEIGRIADEGLYAQNGSFDTQLNQAKREIARIAAEGLAAQGSVPKK